MKKLTYEFVKKQFEDNGCILLETEYQNARTLMKYVCSCGNQSEIIYDSFRRGHRCSKCGDVKTANAKRIKYDVIKQIFVKRNCELLTSKEEYKTVKDYVEYRCSCGEIATVTVDAFMNNDNSKCNNCAVDRRRQTNLDRFGYINPMQHPEIRKKALTTAYQNNTIPTSCQQIYLHSIIGGELNYPVNTSSLDIAFPDEMIYVEYDGGMHDGKVKFGEMTQEQFNEKEKRRKYALYRRGWKEIRVISIKDNFPSQEKLLEMINFARQYLQSHSWISFDIENKTVSCSQFTMDYDFGITKRIRNDNKKVS